MLVLHSLQEALDWVIRDDNSCIGEDPWWPTSDNIGCKMKIQSKVQE